MRVKVQGLTPLYPQFRKPEEIATGNIDGSLIIEQQDTQSINSQNEYGVRDG